METLKFFKKTDLGVEGFERLEGHSVKHTVVFQITQNRHVPETTVTYPCLQR
jgi:hypothetical protein